MLTTKQSLIVPPTRSRLRFYRRLAGLALLLTLWVTVVAPAQTQQPVVRGVMFWLEGCGHCEVVRNEVLPPLQAKYGEQLDILMVEIVTEEDLQRLYQTAALFGMDKGQVGVPFLIMGDETLVGSSQIPARLPALIDRHLAAGGLDYPRLPTLAGLLPVAENPIVRDAPDSPSPAAASEPTTLAAEEREREAVPNGFVMAYVVLAIMVVAVLYAGIAVLRVGRTDRGASAPTWQSYAVLLLALTGVGVSLYMSYVETQHASAVCGPVGDCNAVQSSSYARLLGVPIGVLGVLGYVAILVLWWWQRLRHDRIASYAPLIMFALTFMGTLFSIYLTFLEPFVIGAVCMWCLSQAVIMTLLLLLSVEPVVRSLHSDAELESQ